MLESFENRLRAARAALGKQGEKTTRRSFAAELGVEPWNLQAWEARGNHPRHAYEVLTAAFAKLDSLQARGLDPSVVAAWVLSGNGAPPWETAARRAPPDATRGLDAGGPALALAPQRTDNDPSGEVFRMIDDKIDAPELARAYQTPENAAAVLRDLHGWLKTVMETAARAGVYKRSRKARGLLVAFTSVAASAVASAAATAEAREVFSLKTEKSCKGTLKPENVLFSDFKAEKRRKKAEKSRKRRRKSEKSRTKSEKSGIRVLSASDVA